MPKMTGLGSAPGLCLSPHLPRQHLQQNEWVLHPALTHPENMVINFAYPLKSGECHPDTETLAGLLAGRQGSLLPVSQPALTEPFLGAGTVLSAFQAVPQVYTDPVKEV